MNWFPPGGMAASCRSRRWFSTSPGRTCRKPAWSSTKATATCCSGRCRAAWCRIPWMEEPTAQYLASVHDLDGTPHFADPRNALEAIVKRFQTELNMTPVGAVEVEFFLMDRGLGHRREAARPQVTHQRASARSTTRPITCRTSMISRPSSRTSTPIARRRACRPRP